MAKTIEVSIDDFDLTTDELIAMLKRRGRSFEDDEAAEITDFDTDQLISELEDRGCIVIEADNVIDTMKLDRIRDNVDNVTLDQLEAFFKNPDKFNEK